LIAQVIDPRICRFEYLNRMDRGRVVMALGRGVSIAEELYADIEEATSESLRIWI
jgi:hypothetical protein